MSSGWKFRVGMALAITIASILAIIPSIYMKDADAPGWVTWLSGEIGARITPGLDLQAVIVPASDHVLTTGLTTYRDRSSDDRSTARPSPRRE